MDKRVITVGGVPIGGRHPIVVQSMTNTDTKDAAATVEQIQLLSRNGCDLVRLSVYDEDCIRPLREILQKTDVPLIADIHFNAKLAILSMEAGVHKLRINPGNIGREVDKLAACAKANGVPIRVGANSGSVPKDLLEAYGGVNEQSVVEAALRHVRSLEKCGFSDICVSVKCSDVPLMVRCYERANQLCDYPLHLGVTEAGTAENSTIKSAMGIGALLLKGVGDTIRVSVTGPPDREPIIARKILAACGRGTGGLNVVSCPTCARTGIDVLRIAEMVEERFSTTDRPLNVAVMGCVVNGPGEAREADIGIAGGKDGFVLFRHGKVVDTFKGSEAVESFFTAIQELVDEE